MTILLHPPASAQDENDYEFYKKHGHHSKLWDESVKAGFEAYDQQNCDQALTSLKQAVAGQCQDPLVFFKLAVCSEMSDSPYTALQYYQLAEEKLSKLGVIHRYQKDIYESFGRALYKAKRYNEAFPYLTRAAAVGTPSFGLFYMVGTLFAQKGDNQAALEYYQRALGYDFSKAPPPLVGSIYRELGKVYLKKRDFQNAVAHFDKALQYNPADQEAKNLRSEANTSLGQLSILNMVNVLSGVGKTEGPVNQSQPPPPAAAKLPPLDGAPLKDPTPPLGTVQGTQVPTASPPPIPPAVPPPTTTKESVPMKLEPLPPVKP